MGQLSRESGVEIAALRRRWWGYVAWCLAGLAAGYSVLLLAWETQYALRWLFLSVAAMIYPLVVLRRNLGQNHRTDDPFLFPELGPGNALSLLRGGLVSALAGFLLSPWPPGWLAWVPGILYILADASDFLDGYFARRSDRVTRLGEILEMSFDGFGVLVAGLLLVQYGQAPIWYLLVPLARYLFLAGSRLRRALKKPLYDLPPSSMRRALAGIQMGFVGAILLPIFSPPGTWFAAGLFAVPFLFGFLRDWLWVSGVIRRSLVASQANRKALSDWLPVVLRISLVALAIGMIFWSRQSPSWQASGLAWTRLAELTAILAVVWGFAGRIAAAVGLVILGLQQNISALSLAQYLMAAVFIAILFLGTGRYSAWKPEDGLIFRRIGGRSHPQKPLERPHEAPG
jgi:CDP-diacylglycerol--glycerol-3-phosphate 3-phosphatidyltransferase